MIATWGWGGTAFHFLQVLVYSTCTCTCPCTCTIHNTSHVAMIRHKKLSCLSPCHVWRGSMRSLIRFNSSCFSSESIRRVHGGFVNELLGSDSDWQIRYDRWREVESFTMCKPWLTPLSRTKIRLEEAGGSESESRFSISIDCHQQH